MSQPLFSVIIPTKNRSAQVETAIRSVIDQDFSNYEIIVVDNDDTDETQRVVKKYLSKQVRYLRTGGLAMHDNWEFGFRQAQGYYLTILPDKQILKRRALKVLHNYYLQYRPPVMSWSVDGLYDVNPYEVFFTKFQLELVDNVNTCEFLTVEEIMQRVLHQRYNQSNHLLPRGLNSCCHRPLVEKIINGPMQRLCPPVTPDYTMAFLQLAYTDQVLHLHDALAITTARQSTGYSVIMKQNDSTRKTFIEQAGGEDRTFKYTPIKALLTHNIIINDFLYVQNTAKGNISSFDIHWVDYFKLCYEDIVYNISQGVDMTFECRQWYRAFERQPIQTQKEIQDAIRHLPQIRGANNKGRKILKALYSPVRKVIRQIFKRSNFANIRSVASSPKTVFPNMQQAVVWEEEQYHIHSHSI